MPVKILVIEDDPSWQMRFRERLEGWGYEVELAGDKSEGQLKLHNTQNGFDILLIDPSLTDSGDDRDGLDFLIGLRNNSINTPAIIFTASLNKKLLQELVNEYNDYNIVGALDKAEFAGNHTKVLTTLRKAEGRVAVDRKALPDNQIQPTEYGAKSIDNRIRVSNRDLILFFATLIGLIVLWVVGFRILLDLGLDSILIFTILLILTAFAAFIVNLLSENGLIHIVQLLNPWNRQSGEDNNNPADEDNL